MKPISELKGFNLERLLLRYSYGYMTTGYYKDGMIKIDGKEDWSLPNEFENFILLKDLKNLLNV